jgi:hypothetical protein
MPRGQDLRRRKKKYVELPQQVRCTTKSDVGAELPKIIIMIIIGRELFCDKKK